MVNTMRHAHDDGLSYAFINEIERNQDKASNRMMMIAAQFRKDVKRAINSYHVVLRQTWRVYGKPGTSTGFARDAGFIWRELVRDLGLASLAMDLKLGDENGN